MVSRANQSNTFSLSQKVTLTEKCSVSGSAGSTKGSDGTYRGGDLVLNSFSPRTRAGGGGFARRPISSRSGMRGTKKRTIVGVAASSQGCHVSSMRTGVSRKRQQHPPLALVWWCGSRVDWIGSVVIPDPLSWLFSTVWFIWSVVPVPAGVVGSLRCLVRTEKDE